MTTEELLASFAKSELPWSEEAESALVSIIFNHPARIEDSPPPEAFYHVHHRLLIQVFHGMFHGGKPIDMLSVTHELREVGKLDWIGGASRVSDLYSTFIGAANFNYYASIVLEKYQLRRAVHAMADGVASILRFDASEGVSATDTLQTALKAVNEAVNDDGGPDLESHDIRSLVRQVLDDCENMSNSGKRISGISTGIQEFDEIMGGLEPGCLTVIAAESSDGKSSLGRQILEHAASEGHHVVDYTYEMMPKAEARRVLCSQGKIDAANMKRGTLTRQEFQDLGSVTRWIAKWDFHVVDVAGKTIERICQDISRRARRLAEGRKVVCMIDYIQLCQTSADTPSREREIAHITSTAKQCAKMTGAHIIMPSQVNKDGDVRESMAIEQDSDNLLKIKKIPPPKDKRQPSWKKQDDGENTQEAQFERHIFFHKVRDGERYRTVNARLVGRHFRFEITKQDEG
jgi:replicative DNA helicase